MAAVGVATLTGVAPASGQDARQREQWAVAPGTVFDLPGAWALTRGAGVVVAVVDSGTRIDHPDLAKNIWTNFGEVPGNGKDDDGNGYVDDVHGVDLTTRRKTQNLSDGAGHGTHVAGILARMLTRLVRRVDSLSDIGRLPADRDRHTAGPAIEPHVGRRVADRRDALANDGGDVDVAGGRDLTCDVHEPSGDKSLDRNAGVRVFCEERVQDAVADLVTDLVGMPLGN